VISEELAIQRIKGMANRIAKRTLLATFFLSQVAAAQSAPPRKDIPSIAKAANGSIVSIVMSDDKGKPIAQGTGFVVTKDGLIITNYHVIAQGTSAVAKLPDGKTYALEGIIESNKNRDLALIKAAGNFRALTLGRVPHSPVLRVRVLTWALAHRPAFSLEPRAPALSRPFPSHQTS
jgi:S1-C subfamily serine protease